jgi:hypothetical protein
MRIAVAAIIIGFSLGVLAQAPTATLVGRVTDSSGAVIPGAAVAVRNVDTNELRAATSSADGNFAVPQLLPGMYEVVTEKGGFKKAVRHEVELLVGQVLRLEFVLQVGAVAESVEVRASVPPVNTDTGGRGDVVATDEKDNMPLAGRSFGDLAYLVAGVAPNSDGGYGAGYIVNGARGDNTSFVVDGVTTNNRRSGKETLQPPIDAMQEFKMETSGYSAEFGRLGGGVMSVALKTGTNRLHGSLFEFLRNDLLDARGFFDTDKPPLRRNQFGGTLDGPVRIPKLYNGRDRTFFLISWDGMRQHTKNSRRGRVATDLERAGDFSQTLDTAGKVIPLKDPLKSGNCTAINQPACFPNNVVPAARFHPTALKLMQYYPAANMQGIMNFYGSETSVGKTDKYLFKVDHRLSPRDTITGRFLWQGSDPFDPFRGSNLPGFGIWSVNRYSMSNVAYTRMISPTLINEVRFSFIRNREREAKTLYSSRDFGGEFGITPPTDNPILFGFPSIAINGVETFGDTKEFPKRNVVNNWQPADTLTWVKGKHLIKTGFDLIRTQMFEPWNRDTRGTLSFNNRWSGVGWADFLLGYLYSSSHQSGSVTNYLYMTSFGSFFQDDFKVNSRLTLNLGARWEANTPLSEKYGRIVNFFPDLNKIVIADDKGVPDLPAKIAAVNLQGKVGLARDFDLPQSLVVTQWRNVGPRFGVAWRPFGGTATVVRGGYGIFFANSMTSKFREDLGNAYPFVIPESFSRDSNNANVLTLSNVFAPTRMSVGGTTNGFGYEMAAPAQYLQSWNLTVERGLGKASAIELAYAGSKGTHLGRRYDINQVIRIPAYRQANGSFPRPYPAFSSVNYYSFCSDSTYQSGMVTFRRRFTRNFFYRVNYVYGKSIDYGSQIAGSGNGTYSGAADPRNLKLDRGRSDFDIGHSFAAAFSYEVPKSAGRFLRGWQLSGNHRMYTGQPFTPQVDGADVDNGESNRPDRLRKGTLPNPTADRWFDLSAFALVPRGSYRFGSSDRNILDGPGSISMNLGLMKKFYVGEKNYVQFRWEAFNVTNHGNLKLPNANVNLIAGGIITKASSPRSMQIALKYQF